MSSINILRFPLFNNVMFFLCFHLILVFVEKLAVVSLEFVNLVRNWQFSSVVFCLVSGNSGKSLVT